MQIDEPKKLLPPDVSYRTFGIFMHKFQMVLPTHIDRSYWGEMYSSKTGSHLILAMRFLNFIDANSKPTPRLKILAFADGEHRAAILRQVTYETYDFVLKGTLSIQKATYDDLEQIFLSNYKMKIDTCHKCVKFFVQFSKAAGIPMSPQIVAMTKMSHPSREIIITAKTPKYI